MFSCTQMLQINAVHEKGFFFRNGGETAGNETLQIYVNQSQNCFFKALCEHLCKYLIIIIQQTADGNCSFVEGLCLVLVIQKLLLSTCCHALIDQQQYYQKIHLEREQCVLETFIKLNRKTTLPSFFTSSEHFNCRLNLCLRDCAF